MLSRSKFFLSGILCLALLKAEAQIPASSPVALIAEEQITGDWLVFRDDLNATGPEIFATYREQMGLSADDDMVLTTDVRDDLGWRHLSYQQHYKGVPVEHAINRIHEKDGVAVKGNGTIANSVYANPVPQLPAEEALTLALQCVGAGRYYWEIPFYENMKRHATGDSEATFYPEAELWITDVDFDPNNTPVYRLGWKFEIYSARPEGRYWVYIDAVTGEVFKEMDLHMHSGDYPGVAETRYSGIREIVCDSTDIGFVLRDKTRGLGVETYDAVDSFDVEYAVDFIDDDNYWANANDRADDAATDAHWATEQLYDYLLNVHDYHSYDNQGSRMISYVHYGLNYRNASWNGFWSQYGDATGEPWVAVDVVGHEVAHGITWATAGLLYQRESGALNESFSDIIGETLQYYIEDSVDWLSTPSPIDTIRSYSNPNDYGHPDTYLGDFWETGSGDNYGVHTNSGVQNHWFYLVSEGGEGMNDNGDPYFVKSIGIEAAIDIIMRSMRMYLTPNSGFYDARQGSLFAAEDIFGPCSFEYQQVANAWHAVGVGEPVTMMDFSVIDISTFDLCDVEDSEFVTVSIKHLGCESTGPITLDVNMIKSNPPKSHTEQLELPEGMGPGEVIEYTFTEPFDFRRTRDHSLTARVENAEDLNPGNNSSKEFVVNKIRQTSEQKFGFHLNVAPKTYRDSMAFLVGEFADLDVMVFAGRDSTFGIRIEGARMRTANPVLPGQDLFDINQWHGTQTCLCMDATEMDSLGLQFDLRQTYSSDFEETVGLPQPPSSALRVVADGEELARYFPETNRDDEWKTHNLDLAEFLGREFILCFETRTIQSYDADHDSIGDRVFLDNIEFLGSQVQTGLSFVSNVEQLNVYPNPASDLVVLDIPVDVQGEALVVLSDLNGQILMTNEIDLFRGQNKQQIDLKGMPGGIYLVEVIAPDKRFMARVVVTE